MQKKCDIDECLPLGYNFTMLTKHFYGAFTKEIEGFDLDRYISVLLLIADCDKQWTQQCLCDKLFIDKVTMVKVLDYLEEKGYIKRVTNPEDRRQKMIEPTAKAQKDIPLIKERVKEMNEKTLAGFSKEEKKQFVEMMQRVNDNLSKLPSHLMIVELNKKPKK